MVQQRFHTIEQKQQLPEQKCLLKTNRWLSTEKDDDLKSVRHSRKIVF